MIFIVTLTFYFQLSALHSTICQKVLMNKEKKIKIHNFIYKLLDNNIQYFSSFILSK